MYLNESDRFKHGSLHNAILQCLREQNVAGAYAFHAVAGFMGRDQVHTAGLVEASGNLPVILTFVDAEERVEQVLPRLREMAPHRLIVRENVTVVQNLLG
jgi:PII-like signaling protein